MAMGWVLVVLIVAVCIFFTVSFVTVFEYRRQLREADTRRDVEMYKAQAAIAWKEGQEAQYGPHASPYCEACEEKQAKNKMRLR
ncbi:MAG: hypothetical protein LC754_10445 [Acidobacteria bacterium]|nr:hypothetical protein [Acidobacteriota bacterium]